MNITVVGPGALGCLFAAFLARAGNQVWLLDHNQERASEIESNGLILIEGEKEAKIKIHATANADEAAESELVLLCVKSYDTLSAIRRLEPLLGRRTLLVALQNGIGHHSVLQERLESWAIGVTAQGASLEGVGRVRHGGKGLTTLGLAGSLRTAEDRLKEAHSLFLAAGLETIISASIAVPVWNKLIVNIGINALTALHNCRNGELLERPAATAKLEAAVKEAAAVAAAKGIKVADDPIAMTKDVCRATSRNISSMLQDVRHGRITEIEAINGALVQEARELGIPVPVNEELTRAVRDLQN